MEHSSFKMLILGAGAVGGYYGGKLAAYYCDSKEVEVIFFARGRNKEALESNGLRLITPNGEQHIATVRVTDDPGSAGQADLVLCCLKAYDLEQGLQSVAPCIKPGTIILPLLNGTDATEKIQQIFPACEAWDGCVYIIAKRIAPGVVQETGTFNRLIFGTSGGADARLREIEAIFRAAGIHAEASDQIIREVWEKYLFISPFATLTSYLDGTIGTIKESKANKDLLRDLLNELKNVTDKKGIPLSAGIVQKTFDKLTSLPDGATSSMENDFKRGARTEIDSLTGHVVRLGRELGVATPYYDKMLAALQERSIRIDRSLNT